MARSSLSLAGLIARIREEQSLSRGAWAKARVDGTAPGPRSARVVTTRAASVARAASLHLAQRRSTARSPLGALLAEIREEQRIMRRASPNGAAMPKGHTVRRDPDLRFETRVVSEPPPKDARALSGLWTGSLVFHAALLLAAIVVPLLRPEALSPVSATKAFFVTPGSLAPPPPPPPPPARGAAAPQVRAAPGPVESRTLTAPVETPDKVVPETVDLGAPGGEPGGVEGGIPGGVVGGVVGGLPQLAAPVPLPPVERETREPTKLKHVDPVYPDVAVAANISGTIVLECAVSPQGRVTRVKVIRGIPLLNDAAVQAVKQWVYTPALRDGVPVPVVLTVRVRFGLEERRRADGE